MCKNVMVMVMNTYCDQTHSDHKSMRKKKKKKKKKKNHIMVSIVRLNTNQLGELYQSQYHLEYPSSLKKKKKKKKKNTTIW